MVLNELTSVKNALSVLVLALVIALYLFANSAFFELDQIEWTGLVNLSAEQLDAYLNLPVTNVWRVDMRELTAVLLEHPWIAQAEVTWRWPNRLIVSLKEKVPVAQIPTEAGWLFLDRDGGILPPLQQRSLPVLPIVTNVNLEAPEQLVATARLITLVPKQLMDSISEWNARERAFVTRSGTVIVMGEPVDLEDKFALLEKILEDLQFRGERAARIDLGVPKTPVVTLAR